MTKYVVNISTQALVHTWWGKKWCENIVGLADLDNRLFRGRNYLRRGRIKDLIIENGLISAKVEGREDNLYNVNIRIKPLDEVNAKRIKTQLGEVSGIKENYIPKDCKFLYEREIGVLPSINDIEFECDCPDVAVMCKHIIAVMYAIGCILDQKPLFIFELRSINLEEEISKNDLDGINMFLSQIDDDDFSSVDNDVLSKLFDIELVNFDEEIKTNQQSKEDAEDKTVYIEALSNEMWKNLKKERRISLKENANTNNRKHTTFSNKLLKQYDLEGNLIKTYTSYDDAVNETGIDRRKIYRCVCGEKKTGGGCIWRMEKTGNK